MPLKQTKTYYYLKLLQKPTKKQNMENPLTKKTSKQRKSRPVLLVAICERFTYIAFLHINAATYWSVLQEVDIGLANDETFYMGL